MAKRDTGKRSKSAGSTTNASGPTAGDATEQQVLAFAEQVGRIAGTLQTKAEGWMDREALAAQIARVRDGAASLLEQLAAGAKTTPDANTSGPARPVAGGRSGGVVDAPGKKHRKPLPSDPGASRVDSQAAKLRAATPMVKTNRLRGRG